MKTSRVLILALLAFFASTEMVYASAPKIVGGDAATSKNWPWIVSLAERNEKSTYKGHYCGGVLVRPRWVLTAAHCAAWANSRNTDVVQGRYDLRKRNGKRVAVVGKIIHPLYSEATTSHDVALLRLAKPLRVSPLQLSQSLPASALLHVAGWGARERDFPAKLHQVSVPLVETNACRTFYGAAVLAESMFCAGEGHGQDSCSGDSGGPIVERTATGAVLQGLVSWGTTECGAMPGVYARIDTVRDWILRAMQSSRKWPKRKAGRDGKSPAEKPLLALTYWASETEGSPWKAFQSNLESNYSLQRANMVIAGESWPLKPWPGGRSWSSEVIRFSGCPVVTYKALFPWQGWKTANINICSLLKARPVWRDGKLVWQRSLYR